MYAYIIYNHHKKFQKRISSWNKCIYDTSFLEDTAYEAKIENGEDLDAADEAEDVVEVITHLIGFKAFAVDVDFGRAPELDTQVYLTANTLMGYGTSEAQS